MSSCSLTEHDIIAGRKGAHLNVFFFINDSCKNDKEPESSSIHMTKDEKMAQMTWKTALHWGVTGKQNELACSKELRRFLCFSFLNSGVNCTEAALEITTKTQHKVSVA